jgi:hypothetical protein
MPDDVRSVWSEEELDRALAALNADLAPDERVLAQTRTDVVTAAGEPVPVLRARRRWPRLAASAAAVAAITVGVLVVQTGGENAPSAEAATALNTAADNITATDPVLSPGQYRYIAGHEWTMDTAVTGGKAYSALVEHLKERWVPADWHAEWLERGSVTGNLTWLQGTAEEAGTAGVRIGEYPSYEQRVRCGDFGAEGEPCSGDGSWQGPTPEFLAGLPRDPAVLYERLRTDSGGGPQVVTYTADVLRSGLVPADLRAALYRALAMVPDLEITADVANLDGRRGTAFGIESGPERQDVIVDPATGEFIGERRVATEGWPGIPPGTVTGYTSVTTTVVDEIGVKPAG